MSSNKQFILRGRHLADPSNLCLDETPCPIHEISKFNSLVERWMNAFPGGQSFSPPTSLHSTTTIRRPAKHLPEVKRIAAVSSGSHRIIAIADSVCELSRSLLIADLGRRVCLQWWSHLRKHICFLLFLCLLKLYSYICRVLVSLYIVFFLDLLFLPDSLEP